MPKKYQITIPDPCQKDWDGMQATGLGRYCNSCEKNIQDYSKMSDNELFQLLIGGKPHCGNFDEAQLDRMLQLDRRNLLPTLNLRAVAMGFGILVTTTSFVSNNSSNNPSFDLIEVVKGATPFTYVDQSSTVDELCHFIVMDSESNYLSGVKLELLDEKGHVADVITTDKNGMASYNRAMIKEMRIREIRVIPKSNKHQRVTVAFEGADRTDHEVIQVVAKAPKPPKVPRRYRRKHIRGVMAYGSRVKF
jgi:hypothetical protein